MDAQKQFELNEITYTMTPANADRAWKAVKHALKLLENINLPTIEDKTGVGTTILTTVLANLGEPPVAEIEALILSHTTCQIGDQSYRLSDKFNAHFNQYRSHLLLVLKEGLIYQFSDFFSGGGELLKSMLPASPLMPTKQ